MGTLRSSLTSAIGAILVTVTRRRRQIWLYHLIFDLFAISEAELPHEQHSGPHQAARMHPNYLSTPVHIHIAVHRWSDVSADWCDQSEVG